MAEISYRRHPFPPVIIQHAVWLYLRFTLSYRDVEELLAERGLDISYETIRSKGDVRPDGVLDGEIVPASDCSSRTPISSSKAVVRFSTDGIVSLTCGEQTRPSPGARSPCRDRVAPLVRRLGSEDPEGRARDEMALKVEGVMDGGVHAEKPLGRSSRLEPLHFVLSSSHHLVRIFGSIVLGAEIRTGDRATATPVPPAAEQSLASRRDGRADRRRADVPLVGRRPRGRGPRHTGSAPTRQPGGAAADAQAAQEAKLRPQIGDHR